MAIFGSIIINRNIKGFLACGDVESPKCKDYVEKLIASGKDAVEKILETIPKASEEHQKVLRYACDEILKTTSVDLFLDEMENDQTNVRAAAKDVLFESQSINPTALLNKLNAPNASITQILDIVEFQKEHLKPEQVITQALKISGKESARLFQIANEISYKFDVDAFEIQPSKVDSPDKKLHLLEFLALIKHPKSATITAQFLDDKNQMIKIAALNTLRSINKKFDVCPVLERLSNMKEAEKKIAFPLILALSKCEIVSRLAPLLVSKDEAIQLLTVNLVIDKATTDTFRQLLIGVEKLDEWGRDSVVNLLTEHAKGKLSSVAKPLLKDGNEFIRTQTKKFVSDSLETGSYQDMTHAALSDDWLVREKAIALLGESKQKQSIKILAKAFQEKPESALNILKAVGTLRYSKGLEIAFKGLAFREVAIQRESLKTIRLLANEKHSQTIQDVLLRKIPKLDRVVRDTVEDVLKEINVAFRLKALPSDLKALLASDPLTIEILVDEKKPQPIVKKNKETINAHHNNFNLDDLVKDFEWAGRYKIKKEIGRGAMGRVLLATDTMIDETIIIKFMHPELTADPSARERFIRELKYARKISHTNVIRIHDFLYQHKVAAISMEYFESDGLDDVVKTGKVYTKKEGLNILAQIALGMQAAHDENVVHRDLKPSNILINARGKVKVVDFGIASATAELDANLTKTGTIIGTPAYLSPERAKGMDADHRADIYALGIISFFMFTGELPYKGEPMSLLFQHIEGKAKLAHQINTSLSPELSLLIKKMMAVNPDDRYQSMSEVKYAIDNLLES